MSDAFAAFPRITEEQLGHIERLQQEAGLSYIHYTVQNNQVFSRALGSHTGFRFLSDFILARLGVASRCGRQACRRCFV